MDQATPDDSPHERAVGDIVIDRDDDDPNLATVIHRHDDPASEVVARVDQRDGSEVTVADDNPDYPADAPVVSVVFDINVDPTAIDPETTDRTVYTFPAKRVIPAPDDMTISDHNGDDDSDSVPEWATTVADEFDGTVDQRDGETVVIVEQLGREHVVRDDGSVSGPLDDRLAGRIANLFADID